ncbi:protein-cysteine N-palmitoyltransferase Rasp-like [Contarinia nasturtii]|uniref:protein-cysteine N-palmitoyltransferase Rasp-like n=1 Tax=Contarinia nasturtii TaxID=265458 RepID=UPI0012D384D4|nr:protein-cysteine N-palmitoyltransferase Rasp-like [Contarinia nasturtii]
MKTFLKTKEDIFFLIINISTIGYALFEFYRFGNGNNKYGISYYARYGRSFLSSIEFETEYTEFFKYVSSAFYWLIFHCICCEFVRYINAERVTVVHAIFGISFLFSTYKMPIIATSITALLSFYIAMRSAKKRIVWFTLLAWLCFAGLVKFDMRSRKFISKNVTHLEIFNGITAVGWQIIRLTSYTLDYCDALSNVNNSVKNAEFGRKFSLVNFIAFSFYLPFFAQGPPTIYMNYLSMINENKLGKNCDLQKRVKNLLIELMRLAGTSFVAIVMMHYLYAEAISYDPYLVKELKGWPLYGLAISTGLYFSFVYMLKYQLGSALARFDRIDAPPKPKCCLRIHKNSLTWRHLDKGLYDFVLKYIYIPTRNLTTNWNKCGRFLVYGFVTFWHCPGSSIWVLFWVWSNCAILCIELLGRYICKSKVYERISSVIGSSNMSRINKIFGSQLLIFQTAFALLFLSDHKIFLHVMYETYVNNTLLSYSILSLAIYSLYHVSDLIFQHEKHQHSNEIKNK